MRPERVALVLSLVAATGCLHAEEPFADTAVYRTLSPNGRYAVITDPRSGTRVVEWPSQKPLWRMPGWYRVAFIADNGRSLALGHDGLNLIPHDAVDSLEMVSLWSGGRKIASITLGALVPDRSILARTGAHRVWGSVGGVEQGNRLIVTRADGRRFRFNMETGEAD